MQKLSLVANDKFGVTISGNIVSYNKLKNCKIENATVNASDISNCTVKENASIEHAFMRGSVVNKNATIGVYARLRENSIIGEYVRIGNFVETKNAEICDYSKVSHLTYVGDALIGKNVNVGCGTVFCNYNGKIKQKTIVGNNVFIGSNTNLVAPLVVEDDAFIGAGSTITDNVPSFALAIARSRQINKLNYINKN